MLLPKEKASNNLATSVARSDTGNSGTRGVVIEDNRPEGAAQRKLVTQMGGRPAAASPKMEGARASRPPIQRVVIPITQSQRDAGVANAEDQFFSTVTNQFYPTKAAGDEHELRKELGKQQQSDHDTIDQVSTEGIWTMASVIINNEHAFSTKPNISGSASSRTYSLAKRGEMAISWKDSEVGTLDQAESLFVKNEGRLSLDENRVVVRITGNIGPCNGCKERIKHFLGIISTLLKMNTTGSFTVTIDVDYFMKPYTAMRGDVLTEYGYNQDMPRKYKPKGGGEYTYYRHTIGAAGTGRLQVEDSGRGEGKGKAKDEIKPSTSQQPQRQQQQAPKKEKPKDDGNGAWTVVKGKKK